jgi:antitoxin CcdA
MRIDDGGYTVTPTVTRKKAMNVSIDQNLIAEAKTAGLNVSGILDRALRAELKAHREAAWRAENKEAIESMNAYVEAHGLPLEKYRTW